MGSILLFSFKENGTLQFISDFRNLNSQIKHEPYPMKKIQEMIHNIEGFKYDASLDLNMGYFHITISEDEKSLHNYITMG